MTNFQGKYWVFTINNPTIEQLPPNCWPDVVYVIWQHEKGAEGTEHIQGYACFNKVKRVNWLSKHCCDEAYFAPRMGSHSQAKHYCKKPVPDCNCEHCKDCPPPLGGFWEHGNDESIADKQGTRSDLLACKEMLDQGATEEALADAHFGPWVRYHKAFERHRKLKHGQSRNWITHVTVYWGEPGIGKSQRARYEAGPSAYWLPQPDGGTVWWDGYDGQETVVIDEFYGWIKRTAMQRLCDSTPIMVQNKGGSTPFTAKRIIVTSNAPPSQWWPNLGLGPMERRLTGAHGQVIHMTGPWAAPAPVVQQEQAALVPEASPVLDSPQAFDLMDHYAMWGTPLSEGIDSPVELHGQPPLRRCHGCMRMLFEDGYCNDCLILID